MSRIRSLLEIVVVFSVSIAAVVLVARSPLGQWGGGVLGRPYFEYLALGSIPLLTILLQRRPLSVFGIRHHDLSQQFDSAFRCLFPYAVGKALLFPLGPRHLVHSFAEPVIVLGVIFACSKTLRRCTNQATASLPLALPFMPHFTVAPLVFYPLFLAPAEELLFRGYTQSRLNLAFGRPFRLLGAAVGYSLPITAVLFSLFHVVNIPALAQGRIDPQWHLAVPTLAWGCALGYLRERSESLLTPTLCHGLPQAVAWAFLGR